MIKKLSSNLKILLGAIAGVTLGLLMGSHHESTITHSGIYLAGLVGGVFIDLLKLVLVPLVFSSIVVGIANLRSHHQIHRVWRTTLVYSIITMTLSVVVGISAANLFSPGKGMNLAMFHDTLHNIQATQMTLSEFFATFLHNLFLNPFAALAQGNVLAIVVIALLVGIAIVVNGERYQRLLSLFEELFALSLNIVEWIMLLAPVGIMALLAKLIATQNTAVLISVIKFVIVVLGTTLFHGLIVLPLILYLVTQVSPFQFFLGAKEALLMAFATSSSAATMPITLKCTEQNLQVSPSISRFVVPLGAHLNMDGTALYEAAAALFVANLAGVELTLMQQTLVCLTAMIASVGAPGIPSAGMVTMVMVLQSVGLPIEAIAILLPIDRPLDTLRTVVNVEGDMIGCLVVQRFQKT